MDFFKEDKERNSLVKSNKLKDLKKSYKKRKRTNPNTLQFWDQMISKNTKSDGLDPITEERVKWAVDFIKPDKIKLLDIGVGYGYFEKLLLEKKKKLELFGIDISQKGLERIRKKIPGEFKHGRVEKIPYRDSSFDIVVCLEVLEHISATDIFKALKEIRRVLKKDGQFVVSVPVNERYSKSYNPNRHMRAYTPELFLAELKIARFKVEKSKEFYAFKNLYLLKNILRKILKNRWKPNIMLVSAIN